MDQLLFTSPVQPREQPETKKMEIDADELDLFIKQATYDEKTFFRLAGEATPSQFVQSREAEDVAA